MKDVIIDNDLIRKALCFTNDVPESFMPKQLEPVGHATYLGDSLPEPMSTNCFFEVSKEYPVYENEGTFFVIGTDDGGKKMHPKAWD